MVLNFYLEGAGLIIGILLCCACKMRYNKLDLKDRIYVRMIGVVTVAIALNMLTYFIIRNNVFPLMVVAEVGICVSFLLMTGVWFFISGYLLEVTLHRNKLSHSDYVIFGMPFGLTLLLMLANWGTHSVFDVSKVNDSIQVTFNSWYMAPYALAAISMLLYLVVTVKHYQQLQSQKQYVFFAIPLILLVAYYLQYCCKSVAYLGFSFALVLMLIYVYSYNRVVRFDHLTQLPEADAFKKMLEYRVSTSQNMVVVVIALDDFKRINHEYGYKNGDEFIKEIAGYLEANTPQECLARYGGDKFAVLFEDENVANACCSGILDRFERPWEVGKLSQKLSVCISMVAMPTYAQTVDQVIDLLDYLNEFGKTNKKNQCIVCNDEFKAKMERRARIIAILNEEIIKDKMYVEYQPILEVASGRYSRAEALFRLSDEYLGRIAPYEFFPIAEGNGFVTEIGYALLDKVCQYIHSFVQEGKQAPVISVNFSRQQLMADGLEQRVTEILSQYNLTIEAIAIEVPEEVFASQYDLVKERIVNLHEKGFRFYLDGFGTGFLNLSYLMELPFEVVKINKNMIKAVTTNESICLLVSALTATFEENGKMILGDGIESEELKEMMDMLFMDYLQGYHLSKPISAELAKKEFFEKEEPKDEDNSMSALDDLLNATLGENQDIGIDLSSFDLGE